METSLCYGDSGGAALRPDADTGDLELVGVHSVIFHTDRSAPSCESELSASGSARPDLYQDWILDQIGPEDTPVALEVDAAPHEEEAGSTDAAPLRTSTPEQPDPSGACSSIGLSGATWGWLAGLAAVTRRREGPRAGRRAPPQ